MIRILHTESSMNLGGQELRVLMEMEGLAGRGFYSALAARPGSMVLAEAKKRGQKAFPVSMRGSLDPGAVMSFAQIIRREGIDIVNAHGSKDGWSAGIAARFKGVKVVRSRHVANPIRAHFLGRLVYGPLCDRIVTTSESIKRGMAGMGVDEAKIISVPSGVDTARFDPGVKKGAFRALFNIPAGARVVGMVSVMRGDKGPDVFVRAGEIVMDALPDAFFALVGDGWMAGRLREMVSSSRHSGRFVMPGYIADVPCVLADLDVFALPARVPEGVPQAVLQAHAMKVPVVASDVGGISEVAVDGKTALTVPPGDEAALADAVTKLLKDPALCGSLAEAGYKMVTGGYTMAGMLDAMESIYRGLLEG